VLVVTEKNTNQIDLFPIDDSGLLSSPSTSASDGATPFGFAFGQDHTLLVSEATASTFSSYHVQGMANSLTLQTITASLPDGGAAACWIVTDHSGMLAFVANSGSNTISSLTVSPTGDMQLLDPVAANTGSGSVPVDMALTMNGSFLYVIASGHGAVEGFFIQNGELTPVAAVAGLPLSAQGIAAR
jgi:6-phosphogluconolactonase (cycloisomerase 2 family)